MTNDYDQGPDRPRLEIKSPCGQNLQWNWRTRDWDIVKRTLQIGTSHFVSLEKAAQYYSTYYEGHLLAGRNAALNKLEHGEIHIGPPELKPGETLQTIDNGTRYAIVETDPTQKYVEVKLPHDVRD